MNNVYQDLLEQAFNDKCEKTLSVNGQLVLRFNVTNRMYLQDAIDTDKVVARFLHRHSEVEQTPKQVLVYTDEGYLDWGYYTKYYYPASIKTKPLESLPLIRCFDPTNYNQPLIWFPKWTYRSGATREDIPPVTETLVNYISPHLNTGAWKRIVDKMAGDSWVKLPVSISSALLRRYESQIRPHAHNFSHSIHDNVELLRMFVNELRWPTVSQKFLWNTESLEEFKHQIVWKELTASLSLPSDLYTKYVNEGFIIPWTRR